MAKKAKETPLMKQYNQIKAKYPDALLLFRVGDFYETFGADAVKAAKILGIIQTKRGAGSTSETELAGFPHHSLNTYLPKLVKAGCRVAICDQLEDPKMAKTIVKRGVTELVTPGVALNDDVLEQKKNNYLAAIAQGKKNWGIADPLIKVLGLNPHAGDGGHIGKEEQEFISPAINYLKNKGLNIIGPLSADTAFVEKNSEKADVFIAMFHDQGLPVIKAQGFGETVNITLGLPFIRTSVDHGTAYDISGTGAADESSLLAAIEVAKTMSKKRNNA